LRWGIRMLNIPLALYLLYYLTPLVSLMPPPAELHFYPATLSNLILAASSSMLLMRVTQLRSRNARIEAQARLLAERELELSRHQHAETSGLLSMLLHEIRTPLALIQTATRAIASGRAQDAANMQKMTQRIDNAVRDASNVLERCVEIDRAENSHFTPQPMDQDAASTLRHWLAQHPDQPRIEFQSPEHLPTRMDFQLWLSMVANLVQNALKYSPPEAKIQVQLHAQENSVVLTVTNPVGNVGRPDAARVFEKYYRSNRASRISGTGLGLYWVKVLANGWGQC